jgi:hypothetical protein
MAVSNAFGSLPDRSSKDRVLRLFCEDTSELLQRLIPICQKRSVAPGSDRNSSGH